MTGIRMFSTHRLSDPAKVNAAALAATIAAQLADIERRAASIGDDPPDWGTLIIRATPELGTIRVDADVTIK